MSDKEGFSPDDFARYVRWAILLFIIYAVIQSLPQIMGEKKPETPVEAQSDVPGQAAYLPPRDKDCDCSGNAFNNFSLLAIPLFPTSSPAVSTADIKAGEGEQLSCGQKATLRYTYATRGGDIIFSNMKTGNATKNLKVGGGEMLQGFERGIIGMRVGGERDIFMPNELAFGGNVKISSLRDSQHFKFAGAGGIVTARASLISIDTPLPASDLKLRMFDQKMGDGLGTECGDTVKLMLALWSVDGKQLYVSEASNPLVVTAGKSQLPYGIEQGLLGLGKGGRRTLIIPPSYLAPLDPKVDSLIKGVELPKDQVVLATLEIFHETSKPAVTPILEKLMNKPQATPTKEPEPAKQQ